MVAGGVLGSRSYAQHKCAILLRNSACAICVRSGRGHAHQPPSCTTRGSCARSRTRSATGSSPSSTRSGPLRAADVAAALGIPANQASFHLRQLAKFGLVEEDPAAARDKRDRVWRATEEAGFDVALGEIEKAPGGKAASAVFRQTKARLGAPAGRRRPTATTATPGIQRTVTEQAVRLTKDEARRAHRGARPTWSTRGGSAPGRSRRRPPDLPRLPDRPAVPRPAARATLMAARLRPADPAEVAAALARVRGRRPGPRRPAAAHQALPRRPRGAGARPLGRGPGPAVRRGAGDPRRPAHPRHPAGGGRDRRRDLDRAGHRRARLGRRRGRRAGSARAASAPTWRRTSR